MISHVDHPGANTCGAPQRSSPGAGKALGQDHRMCTRVLSHCVVQWRLNATETVVLRSTSALQAR